MIIKHIMIVDDDPDLVHLLTERTESFGFECHGYSSIDKALMALKKIKPDLIVLNLEFAQSNGTMFLDNIQHHLNHEDSAPPVIILNSEDDDQITDYAYDLGVTAFNSKPYNLSSLSNLLTDYMPRESQTPEEELSTEDELWEGEGMY
ncbi:MAG: response regulator [Deltaproteobacteria bacterium]|nr:response regulator [Deltaproteobacteria bacterium]